MRISDWSSDVCSSDLRHLRRRRRSRRLAGEHVAHEGGEAGGLLLVGEAGADFCGEVRQAAVALLHRKPGAELLRDGLGIGGRGPRPIGKPSIEESVCEYE